MEQKEKKADESYCSSCGEIIKTEAEICPHCGVRQKKSSSLHGEKNKIVAALLAILLGGIGAHKFYLGKIVEGLLYLCLCWTFIPALVGLIEGLIYLSKSDEDFEEQYG
ncbi:NINE protein [Methanohalophilus profundi]|uniref:NINE protein n=1 Tax=Methanohalophilus profundi TaxID=2138083 RepID=UPI00101C0CF4|nr:NINE protein [Methanohalophilus profundi]